MYPTSTPTPAERRRTAHRLDIARTAVRLIAERGYDNVTVEAFAEAAGISTRTFYRYFPVKEDVVVPLIRNGTAAIAERLAERPTDEPLVLAIPAAFTAATAEPGSLLSRDLAVFIRLLTTHTVLRGRWLDAHQECESALTPVIARRFDRQPEDPEVRLVALAVMSALRFGLERWAETQGEGDRGAMIGEALRFLADGAMLSR